MKKVIFALLAALMLFTLAACGGKGGSGGGAAKNVDLAAYVQSLQTKYENADVPFIATMDMTDPEYKAAMFDPYFPGLEDIPTKQMVAYQPMMSFVVCELVAVEVENSSDVQKVKDILQKRINDQVAGGAQYPDSIENWDKNSRVVDNGNYVMMIAWENCDEAVAEFNALFK